jgi:hypothetical protein
MAQTSIAVSTPPANSVTEAHQQYPATEQLTYMDVAARGLISRDVRAAMDQTRTDPRLRQYPIVGYTMIRSRGDTLRTSVVATLTFIRHLHQNIYGLGNRQCEPVMRVARVDALNRSNLQGEVVTCIGGVIVRDHSLLQREWPIVPHR